MIEFAATKSGEQKCRNVVLVGPMGAGKTTIGRRLAKQLGREFLDSDEEIVRRTGVEIPVIFEIEGEDGFRDRERRVIAELCERRGVVLATGGGAVMCERNRRALADGGYVVYLQTSVDEQLRRVRLDGSRPMLRADDPKARLEALLAVRDPLYREIADCVVDTEKGYLKQAVRRIVRRLPAVSSERPQV